MSKEHDDIVKEVELLKKFDERYEPKHKTRDTVVVEKKNSNTGKNIGIILLVAVIVIGLLFYEDIEIWVTNEEEIPEEPLSPAELLLYKFSDLASNTSVNLEFWLINLGESPATNIEIYVRVRNQNGTVLLSDEISPTVLVLRYNETCSAIYSVPISEDDEYILHTIEISVASSRIAYSKQTTL